MQNRIVGAALLSEHLEQDADSVHSFGRTKLADPLDFRKFLVDGEVEFTMEPSGDAADPLDLNDGLSDWEDDFDYPSNDDENENENMDSNVSSYSAYYVSNQDKESGNVPTLTDPVEPEPSSPSENNDKDKPIVTKSLPYFDDILAMKEADKTRWQKRSMEAAKYSPLFHSSSTSGMRILTDDGELLKRTDHPGNGRKPTFGSKVWIHLNVFKESDMINPIDSTHKKKPLSFTLFNHDVLAVLEYGVASMEVKERACFLASPKYAYGPLGVPNLCEANTNCFFYLELVDSVDETLSKDLVHLTQQQQADFGFHQVMKAANQFKAKGNRKYIKKRWTDALQCYRKGVLILDRHVIIDSKQESQRNDLLFVFYNNMAQCYLGMEDGRHVLSNCAKAEQLPPGTNGKRCKLAFRQAKGYKLLGNVDKALEACRKAMTIEPTNTEILTFYKDISSSVSANDATSKDMFQKMATAYFAPKSAEETRSKEASK